MNNSDLFVVQRTSGANQGVYKVQAKDVPSSAVVSNTAPPNPWNGLQWFDTNSQTLKIWNGSSWVESAAAGGVTQIVAGNNVTINPSSGDGVVTINAEGGGVSSIIAGDGISVNRGTGDVTITNTGGGDSIINNGASAWALTDNSGNMLNSLNFASATRTGAGKYVYVFATPMPSANYSCAGAVTDATGSSTNGYISFSNLSATGLTVTTKDGSNSTVNRPHSLAVFAANALPPKGGTGIDAWASTSGDATLLSSFNFESVTKSGNSGRYIYTFTTPMPDALYAVQATSNSSSQDKAGAYVYNKLATGFSVQTFKGDSGLDAAHSVSVNCTNATLPSTFTEPEIQAVVDLAQNPQGIALAWAQVNGSVSQGTNLAFRSAYNIKSWDKTAPGTFTFHLADNLTFSSNDNVLIFASSRTGLAVADSAILDGNGNCSFEVTTFDLSGSASNPPYLRVLVYGTPL